MKITIHTSIMAISLWRLLAVWVGIFSLLFLSACSSNSQQSTVSQDNPANAASADVAISDSAASAEMSRPSHNDSVHADEKLGTKWGDEIDDSVTSIEAKRLSDEPIGEIAISYAGKEFQGSAVKSISLLTGQVQLSILDDQYNPLPVYRLDGNYYLKAKENQSYYLHYRNSSSNTYEIIASVDGINVLTGNAASKYSPTGYILDARGELTIKGFRKDEHSVASFTFSKPENSYANHSAQGDIGNVGIIGTVVYELQMPKQNPKPSFASPPTNKPKAFPTDK